MHKRKCVRCSAWPGLFKGYCYKLKEFKLILNFLITIWAIKLNAMLIYTHRRHLLEKINCADNTATIIYKSWLGCFRK